MLWVPRASDFDGGIYPGQADVTYKTLYSKSSRLLTQQEWPKVVQFFPKQRVTV